jgi:hypothetical protein
VAGGGEDLGRLGLVEGDVAGVRDGLVEIGLLVREDEAGLAGGGDVAELGLQGDVVAVD